jgi:3-oxoacyl-[acyl-carrier-protein] synthase III
MTARMFLHALGHFHPETLLTNAFLQDIGLETDDAWILERVGIRTRHTVLPLDYIRETRNRDVRAALEAAQYSNAETGRRAALMALQRAGLGVEDVGMVVAGGCSPDECIPAEACRIAEALGIEASAMDLNAACSSFCAQLHFLAGMRPERLPDFILVVNPENSTRVVDYSDRSSSVLWGDGRRGNCGASGAPTVLSEHWDDSLVGDAVALSVVGSGLTWAGTLLERHQA